MAKTFVKFEDTTVDLSRLIAVVRTIQGRSFLWIEGIPVGLEVSAEHAATVLKVIDAHEGIEGLQKAMEKAKRKKK